MINSTLIKYKESFEANLLAFLNEYEDNTKTFFLQKEKEKYRSYQKALTKIKSEVEKYSSEELKSNPIHKSIASDLKRIDQNIYNSIITELNPVQNENVLSLSAAKKDRIKIDETALENHIKSSIVILKFINSEFEVPYIKPEIILDQIDRDLWNWLKEYEKTHKYIPIPLAIEEKPNYVKDSFYNYEERNYKYQIEICNIILKEALGEQIILDYKKNFESKLQKLRKDNPIPNTNIESIISDINNAFFRLEKFMEGSVTVYQSFLFNDAFTLFFNELNKVENVNERNFKLRDNYHNLLCHINYAFDKSEFKNQDAYENEDFNRDCNEIGYIHFYRMAEFGIDTDLDNTPFVIPSILDIVKETNTTLNSTITQSFNPPVQKKIESLVYNENLVNDPLFNKENEHIIIKQKLDEEITERLEQNRLNDIFYANVFDDDFQDWEKNENIKIVESFKQLVKKLNQEKVFFFGCSFENYKHNYEKRLNAFLDEFYDAEESDFIKSEGEFLENILYDIQNAESAHDGHAVSGYDNFSKAYEIVIKLGFDQYVFSNNKKTAFLKERKALLFSETTTTSKLIIEDKDSIENDSVKTDCEKPNNFLESTIHEYLEEFKSEINGNSYDILVNALFEYFSNGSFPTLTTKINFKKINKKRVGWALKELYKSEKTSNLEIEYFRFAKDNINLFADEIIVEQNFNKSKFYKAFTTNPAK